jgi:ABC-type uncharacterized transport system permease subunit
MDQFQAFLASAMRQATPLLLAGLGLLVSERSGLLNIGVEGVMLMGAFSAYAGTVFSGTYWVGLLIAMLTGILMIFLFALLSITFRATQVVVGAGMNIFCTGLSAFLYRKFFFGTDVLQSGITIDPFPPLPIPGLSKIPILGPMLFDHNILVYFALIMVPVIAFVMNRTQLGMKIIAVGEHPRAADSLGIDVIRLRYGATLFSGLMIGVAGAYLSIAQTSAFAEGMTSGKGYIAMAVVILGKWKPVGALAGALLFGLANALQMNIQNLGVMIPNDIITMIPYIATVLAVVAVSKNKVVAPSAQGVPYEKS